MKQQNKTKFSIFNFQFSRNTGFSLIELLVVISIIAILSAVLTANFMGMRERARDAQKIQDLYAIKNALRLYYNDNQIYPPCPLNPVTCLNTAIAAYMPAIANIGYTYSQTLDGDGFVLTVGLEAGAGTEDTDSQNKCGTGTNTDKLFAVCAN